LNDDSEEDYPNSFNYQTYRERYLSGDLMEDPTI